MEETWLPCAGKDTEGYEVSNKGRVRNARTRRILKNCVSRNGCEIVCINRKTKQVHKLVADAFIQKDHAGLDIVHRDRDRSNNCVDNLECCTRSENMKRLYLDGKEQTHRMKPVRCVETGEEYKSIIECARNTGLDRRVISRCVNDSFCQTRDGRHFEEILCEFDI